MNRIFRWLDLGSWDNWLPLSIISVFVLIGIVLVPVDFSFGIPRGEFDRYQTIYIDIGVQTTAGIFAIIISLSLVAIQFAAQEYSPRIMEFYIKSVVFWSTLVVYLFAILFGIFAFVGSSDAQDLRLVQISLLASVLTLVLLIPHFIITASYLKPEFIISKLLRSVDRTYLRSLAARADPGGGYLASAGDRLLPVVELTERSIDRGDVTTTRRAISQILDLYIELGVVLNSPHIVEYFMNHLTRVGQKAIAQPDEAEASVQAMDALARIGKTGPADLAIEKVETLGFFALRRDSEVVVLQMIESLRWLFDDAPLDAKARILATFRDLIDSLSHDRHQRVARILATHLTDITTESRKRTDAETESRSRELLLRLGLSQR